jgi:excisionase family DNA binding protein
MRSNNGTVIHLPPLLNQIPVAARRLGLSRSTLYVFIKERRLRVVKVGKRALIEEAELRRFAAELAGHADDQPRAA